uniref:DNA primase n=1 Tax=Dermatophagoides pteronyssinus TaxID=6956 RepID=A0A6P6YN85_DERPT|nr:DNA primase small subunit-like [Dermatophagoides pteronyssinus]
MLVADGNPSSNRDIAIFIPFMSSSKCIRPIYIDSIDTFKKTIFKFEALPYRIDIGASYDRPIAKSPHSSTQPLRTPEFFFREFIIDIDIDDYDIVRTCCKGKTICGKCWVLMKICTKVLVKLLTEHLGFTEVFIVYSGNRGLHFWVFDRTAGQMDNALRAAVTTYISLVPKIETNAFIPKLLWNDVYEIAIQDFEEIVKHQDIFNSESLLNQLNGILAKQSVNFDLKAMVSQLQTKYKLSQKYDESINVNLMLWNDIFKSMPKNFVQLVVIYCTYPRLDVNVSKDSKHLLKLPFSVHPTSKKLSVPIDIRSIDSFDPSTCISLHELSTNIEKFEREIQQYVERAKISLFSASKNNSVAQHNASLSYSSQDLYLNGFDSG